MELEVIKLNKTNVYIGSITKEPEIKESQSGVKFLTLNVACETSKKNPDNDHYVSEFIQVTVYGAEAIYFSNLHKQDKVELRGVVRKRTYEKNDGTEGVSYEMRNAVINVGTALAYRINRKMDATIGAEKAAKPVDKPAENLPEGFVEDDSDDLDSIPF